MRTILMTLATAVTMALLACGVAVADTVTTDFERFNLGNVDGQDGWKSGVVPPALPNGYDQEVVNNGGVVGFGLRSLRMSNLFASGEFTNQTYSSRSYHQPARTRPIRSTPPSSRSSPRRPDPSSPGSF
jgi:hypothetical protein